MNFLKGLALAFFSLALILSLSIFALAFSVKSTALNADFINRQLENLDVSASALEVVNEQPDGKDLPESVRQQLEQVLPQLEAQLKTAAGQLIEDILAYLNRETSNLDLKLALKESFLNVEFITTIIDRLDLPLLVEDFIGDEFLADIPPDIAAVINMSQLASDIATDLEPWLKDQIEVIVPPVLNYILGDSPTLSVVILLSPIKEAVRDNLWQTVLALSEDEQQNAAWDYLRQNPPPDFKDIVRPDLLSRHPEYSGLTEAQLDPLLENYIFNLSRQQADPYLDTYWDGLSLPELRADYDRYFDDYVGFFPASAEIDQETIGSEIVADLNKGLADASDGLAQARKYTGWFITGYWAVIGLILLSMAAIILITGNFKKSSRGLGITFLILGAMEFAGVLITRNLAPDLIPSDAEMPAALESYLPQLLSDAIRPLEVLSLVLMSIGVILIAVSIIYKQPEAK